MLCALMDAYRASERSLQRTFFWCISWPPGKQLPVNTTLLGCSGPECHGPYHVPCSSILPYCTALPSGMCPLTVASWEWGMEFGVCKTAWHSLQLASNLPRHPPAEANTNSDCRAHQNGCFSGVCSKWHTPYCLFRRANFNYF